MTDSMYINKPSPRTWLYFARYIFLFLLFYSNEISILNIKVWTRKEKKLCFSNYLSLKINKILPRENREILIFSQIKKLNRNSNINVDPLELELLIILKCPILFPTAYTTSYLFHLISTIQKVYQTFTTRIYVIYNCY